MTVQQTLSNISSNANRLCGKQTTLGQNCCVFIPSAVIFLHKVYAIDIPGRPICSCRGPRSQPVMFMVDCMQ